MVIEHFATALLAITCTLTGNSQAFTNRGLSGDVSSNFTLACASIVQPIAAILEHSKSKNRKPRPYNVHSDFYSFLSRKLEGVLHSHTMHMA